MDVVKIEGIVAALMALSGVAAYVGRKLWTGARLAVRAADLIVGDGTDQHPGVDRRLKTVEHEVRTNGGGSIKDSVNRNEASLMRLESVVERVAIAVQDVAASTAEAKERAAEAVDEAAKLSAALGRADAEGRQQRRNLQNSLDAVLDAFLQDRAETHQKTTAYVDALKSLGIDLTDVARELEAEPWDGTDRRNP